MVRDTIKNFVDKFTETAEAQTVSEESLGGARSIAPSITPMWRKDTHSHPSLVPQEQITVKGGFGTIPSEEFVGFLFNGEEYIEGDFKYYAAMADKDNDVFTLYKYELGKLSNVNEWTYKYGTGDVTLQMRYKDQQNVAFRINEEKTMTASIDPFKGQRWGFFAGGGGKLTSIEIEDI